MVQHVGHSIYLSPGRGTDVEWAFAALVVAATKWAVPVFVMLSGALLLEPRPEEPLKEFYRKRFTRVGIPLLFWSAFYLGVQGVFGDASISDLGALLLAGRPYYHIHFLFAIAGLYLFAPMLRTFASGAAPDELRWAVWLSLGIATAASLVGAHRPTAFTIFVPYVGYFLAGWWIRQGIGQEPSRRWAGPLFLAAIALLFAASVALGEPKGRATLYLHGYLSLPLIAMSLSAFVLMLQPGWIGSRDGAFARTCAWLSPLTLGIYLIHPAVLKLLSLAGISGANGRVEIAIPLVSALAFAVSAAATAALRRVRPLALLVGG